MIYQASKCIYKMVKAGLPFKNIQFIADYIAIPLVVQQQ